MLRASARPPNLEHSLSIWIIHPQSNTPQEIPDVRLSRPNVGGLRRISPQSLQHPSEPFRLVCRDIETSQPPFELSDRKSTRLNSSHADIYTLSLHDALPICRRAPQDQSPVSPAPVRAIQTCVQRY